MARFRHNKPMLRSCFILFCLSFSAFSAQADSIQKKFVDQFRSSRIEMPAEDSAILMNSSGRYPEPLNFLFESVLGWIPKGESKLMSAPCDIEVWQQRLMDPRILQNAALQGALIQKYFQDCRTELETGVNAQISNFTKMMTMKFDFHRHSFFRRVVLNLPGNVKLKGLLGLKGDFKKRPFVVIRLGIFGSIEDFKPERAWAMMLFEQAPFNVLILENMSSSDFIANNSQFSFGGYDEGIQNIHVARLLKNPAEPLSQVVQSIHMFGVSLGGHGVLYSSLLNKFNSPAKNPLINSFTALCPVVHLKPTMTELTQGGFKSAFVDLWSRQRLQGLDAKIPTLVTHDSFSFLAKAISEISRTYRGGLSYNSSIKLQPGASDSENFWELNNFWKDYKQVEQPVLIYATQQDPAVPFDLNSQKLINKETTIPSKNIRVVELPQGVHCTLPVAYDWHVLSSLLQTYILSHSPGFSLEKRTLDFELDDEEWKGFFDKGSLVTFKVSEPGKKAGFANLEIEIENAKSKTKSMKLSLPLSQFDFRFLDDLISGPEQEMVVRWLNQNLKFTIIHENHKNTLRAEWNVAK